RALAPYLGRGLDAYDPEHPPEGLSSEQARFLGTIRRQTRRARKAVGLWNIEPYDDIEPPEGFGGPLETVYSVSQGFKPNILLERLGFTPRTQVVFFDYSRQALEVRRYIVEHWDGDDFPGFVDQIFRTFPDPETHYYLWGGLRPHEIDGKDMEHLWQRELSAWGGESTLRRHWRRYRALPHRYVCCDLLADPAQLLDQVRGRGPAAIWWSNAFFTLYSNWYFSIAERRQRYERFLAELAGRRPELCLFGSDPANNSVNHQRAASYLEQLRALCPSDPGLAGLEPLRLHAVQIPM
ncbi:MAG: hypothetical protein MI919_37480, partial [Holophagales bacterium]|nr:hypothetical protein [Holophagales bacterium]